MDSGILLVDKAVGLTSRAIDNAVSKKLAIRKCGHLGTLDPFASGLLLLALGKATKLLPYLDSSKKSYIASLKLGQKTDTGDPTGTVIETEDVPELSMEDIAAVLRSFLGKSAQIPPRYSALKIDGKEAYKRARSGEDIALRPREIEIHSINPVSYDKESHVLLFTCTVSSGTYVRTLGEDIATKLGTVGHLDALRRLSIGNLLVANAKPIDGITKDDLLEPYFLIRGMKHVEVGEDVASKAKNGMVLDLGNDYGESVFVCHKGEVLAAYKKKEGALYSCERGLWE